MRMTRLAMISPGLVAIALCVAGYITSNGWLLIPIVFAMDVFYAAYSVNQRDISWRRYFAGMEGGSIFKLFLYYVACTIYASQYIPWPDELLVILGAVGAVVGGGTVCVLIDMHAAVPEPFKSLVPVDGAYRALQKHIGSSFNVIATRSVNTGVPTHRSYQVNVLEFPHGNAHHMLPCYAILVNRENWQAIEPGYIPATRMIETLVGTAAFVGALSYNVPGGIIYYVSPDKYNAHTASIITNIDNAWNAALKWSAPTLEYIKADLEGKWPKGTKENQMMHAALLLYLQRKGQLHPHVLDELAKELNI